MHDKNEWLKRRAKGIGGTDAAAIVGLDKYRSPLAVFLEKTGQSVAFEGNEHTRRGQLLEQAVADWFGQELGVYVMDGEQTIHIAEPIFRGTPDFFYTNDNGESCVLECKTTLKKMNGEPDPKWYTQLQWYLGITGAQEGSIAWMESGFNFFYTTHEKNDAFIAELQKTCYEFWQNHIVTGIAPEPRTLADVELLFPKEITGKSIEAVNYVADLVNEYKALSIDLKLLTDRKEELSEQIKIAFGDAEKMMFGDEVIATYKANKDSIVFDAKKFQTEMPDVYSKYTKLRANSRVLRVK